MRNAAQFNWTNNIHGQITTQLSGVVTQKINRLSGRPTKYRHPQHLLRDCGSPDVIGRFKPPRPEVRSGYIRNEMPLKKDTTDPGTHPYGKEHYY